MSEYFSAKEAVTLTAHDTNALARRPQMFVVGVGGNAVVRAQGSSADVTFTGLTAGQVIPLTIGFLRSTGTTATLIGLF
jgi:hypothetical protein